ncbi:UDP-N-acetylglucosamine 1-carboxyvinyltransferase [Heliophilum fasciatum]|uniref:UDP-N-acetylglucosamine 1-carboxyvinyltransferase n=1 Tax=Heliophilum fasciatum TaxID=35700 RepID=A0A4R2RI44_9FIRM|nr:UDP-N-acetylglucosamine 1-carboxyvinyltransferase [Heliophilum fasciatum]MCW2278859.1 UDP-N-acetylglucosamine 1-carboxyvinyltransferase [Heliophilum fasciatum]TCP62129.1 UDP-N-acetylglucosamine 1-carboxyvinyltransferase [Heliophilum fasciatum]
MVAESCIRIKGGTPLRGTVAISGAKNAILPIMAAALMSKGRCELQEVPQLQDVLVMCEVLRHLGATVTSQGNSLVIDAGQATTAEVSSDLMRRMRASNLVLGPLLARFGRVRLFHPGGCSIGSRPMDLHVKGLGKMGAVFEERFGYYQVEATRLQGAEIHLDFPSVGATENLMMAACLAKGTTVIRNAAKEPEIVDLQNFLNSMGAKVRGAGLDVIRIEGVDELHDCQHTIIPDRIEAGTFMIGAAMTGGDIRLTNVIPEHLEPIMAKLREVGVGIIDEGDSIRVFAQQAHQAVNLKTMPYPGFPTDMQPQLMALMTISEGTSIITESIFENRFKHVDELRRMGADIRLEGRVAIVKGVPRLSGAVVEATDLRAGAALILAGLSAENGTTVEKIFHVDRGYERLVEKFSSLGAKIERIPGG